MSLSAPDCDYLSFFGEASTIEWTWLWIFRWVASTSNSFYILLTPLLLVYTLHFKPSFFLCREWTEDGQLWIQYVSSTPATRLDVVNLQEQLDHQLQSRQARETGICPVREELYAQCFGECSCYFVIYLGCSLGLAFCCEGFNDGYLMNAV